MEVHSSLVSKNGLLLGAINSLLIGRTILAVEFDIDLASEACCAAFETSGLDQSQVGKNFSLGVNTGATVGAEEMLVNLARAANNVKGLGRACRCISDCTSR